MDDARAACIEIEDVIKNHPEDGKLYDSHIVEVWRENGVVKMRGKPIRFPMIFAPR